MNKKTIKPLESQYVPSEIENEIISFWNKNKTFEKSVDQRDKKNTYRFYDGPPFVTGLPHYGHILGSIIKDAIPRFQTMKGKRVERVWGWDCHGLPVENKVEQRLEISSKKEIEALGIEKFVDECRSYVSKSSSEWDWYVDHVGRWVDMKNAYRTMDKDYMESVIWVFKTLYDNGHIYKGNRVSLFCPRCSSPISNFEIAMDNSYKDVTDPSVFVKFKLIDEEASLLAWTTTPWTLPTNFALAVGEDIDYVLVQHKDEKYILAKKLAKQVLGGEDLTILKEFKGKDLIGKKYEPLYSCFESKQNDHQVYPAEFVSVEDGTGVVHIAPGFGEDDTDLGKKHNLSFIDSVDDSGKLDPIIEIAQGKYFKSADKLIMADLEKRGLLEKSATITHSCPHCYRCETPLLYKSQNAWYINVQDIKEKLIETNQDINWVPNHFKHGRFELGIKSAPDWCISRSRYWGTPMPIWECECGERTVLGSIKEMEELSGQKVTELHRPDIDEIKINCPKCGKKASRIPEVLDCWMESASMPYAQVHYPFKNEQKFKDSFPADFIVEYTGQLRAWFYVTHVISNLLFESKAFKNVVVTGVIMGSDGKKMSKSKGNYPDPKSSLEKLGGDALRLYLLGSSTVLGQDIVVSDEEWAIELKSTINILWNSYKYFVSYASLENWKVSDEYESKPTALDRWILTRLDESIIDIDENLSTYQIPKAVSTIKLFITDLSTWYIRRSRDRVGPSAKDEKDKQQAYITMYSVFEILSKAFAPIIPFVTEYIYKHLTGEESVHLTDWPEVTDKSVVDKKLLSDMDKVRKICEMGNAQRREIGIPTKQALLKISVSGEFDGISDDQELIQLIKDELNIEDVEIKSGEPSVLFDITMTEDLKEKGQAREIIRNIQEARKIAGCKLDEVINISLPFWPASQEEEIKRKALVKNISIGEEIKITRI